jgi:tetratricopeptide (TPR) repeat protein
MRSGTSGSGRTGRIVWKTPLRLLATPWRKGPARAPLEWATTRNNLGNALRAFGELEAGTARLEKAVAAYHDALKELTRERVPVRWAMTQYNLAEVYLGLFKKSTQTRHLDDALVAVGSALEGFHKAKASFLIDKAERLREKILAAKGTL